MSFRSICHGIERILKLIDNKIKKKFFKKFWAFTKMFNQRYYMHFFMEPLEIKKIK